MAALSHSGRLASHPLRSPLLSTTSVDRPLTSLRNNQGSRQPGASAHRVGCKPATHSARLVPLRDTTSFVPATTATSRRAPRPAATAPVPAAPRWVLPARCGTRLGTL